MENGQQNYVADVRSQIGNLNLENKLRQAFYEERSPTSDSEEDSSFRSYLSVCANDIKNPRVDHAHNLDVKYRKRKERCKCSSVLYIPVMKRFVYPWWIRMQ